MVREISVLELGMDESFNDMSSDAANSDSEAELIERAKTDPEAFGMLFELHYQRILNYLYRCTLNLAAAEELASNTFYKAFRSLGGYSHRLTFPAWLYRIATNEIRMHWRSQARRQKINGAQISLQELNQIYFELPGIMSEESILEKMRLHARVLEQMALLPERYRSVLTLRFFEQLPYDAIAEVLGKRIGTVKSWVHRAVHRLRKILEKDATFDISRHLD